MVDKMPPEKWLKGTAAAKAKREGQAFGVSRKWTQYDAGHYKNKLLKDFLKKKDAVDVTEEEIEDDDEDDRETYVPEDDYGEGEEGEEEVEEEEEVIISSPRDQRARSRDARKK